MKKIGIIGTVVYDQILTARESILEGGCSKMNLDESMGGSMHNIAWNLGALEMNPVFITKLGNDDLAKKAETQLTDLNVDVHSITIPLSTPRFYLMQDNTKHELFCTISDEFYFNSTDIPFSIKNAFFDFGITDQDDEEFLKGILLQTPATRWIMNGFVPTEIPLTNIEGCILNEFEMKGIQHSQFKSPQAILKQGCKWLCITEGENGATLYTNGKALHYTPNILGKRCNTLGCGDAFSSGVLYGLACNKTIEESIQIAIIASEQLLQTPSALSHNIKNIKESDLVQPLSSRHRK